MLCIDIYIYIHTHGYKLLYNIDLTPPGLKLTAQAPLVGSGAFAQVLRAKVSGTETGWTSTGDHR